MNKVRAARRLALAALACMLAAAGLPGAQGPAAAASGSVDFAGWHLPLPGGEWRISRGPCGSAADYRHDCDYYENQCAVDLIPAAGRMTGAPVLAPYAGQVFFMGTRDEAGLTLMLLHTDGRLSAYMHLSQVAVGLDQVVAQGEVVGYAGGTGDSGQPHLHFFVQPDAVERRCLDLTGLDGLDYRRPSVVSHNRPWTSLVLPDPSRLPAWLPRLAASGAVGRVISPRGVALAPGARAQIPLALLADDLQRAARAEPLVRVGTLKVARVLLGAPPRPGTHMLGAPLAGGGHPLRLDVRPAPDTRPAAGLLLINPEAVSPPGFIHLDQTPQLCWTLGPRAGQAPLSYRVVIVGPLPADSGWIDGTCWQPPDLPGGTYFWKVFVRDARGYMNRTNQRPAAFIMR